MVINIGKKILNVHYFLPNTKINIKISPARIRWQNIFFKQFSGKFHGEEKEKETKTDTQQ